MALRRQRADRSVRAGILSFSSTVFVDDGVGPHSLQMGGQWSEMAQVCSVAHHAIVVVCLVIFCIELFSWLTDYVLPLHYQSVKYLLSCAIAPALLYTLSEITTVGIAITRPPSWIVWISFTALIAWLKVLTNGHAIRDT